MERKKYLELCQKVSMFVAINRKIPQEMLVKFDCATYCPKGYEITFEKGYQRNRAILKDLKANSLIYAKLERVESNA